MPNARQWGAQPGPNGQGPSGPHYWQPLAAISGHWRPLAAIGGEFLHKTHRREMTSNLNFHSNFFIGTHWRPLAPLMPGPGARAPPPCKTLAMQYASSDCQALLQANLYICIDQMVPHDQRLKKALVKGTLLKMAGGQQHYCDI